MGCLPTAKFLKTVSGSPGLTAIHTRFRFCLFRVTAIHKLYLLARRGGGDQTHRSVGRARLDLAFQTRADVCQRDMGRGEGSIQRFHSPSASHSQTFPLSARGVRLTRPGCGALGAGLGARSRGVGAAEASELVLGFSGTSWVPGDGLGAARSGGRRFGSGFRCPPAGSAPAGRDWALGVRVAGVARSLIPHGAPGAEAAAAQADNELGARRALAGLGPHYLVGPPRSRRSPQQEASLSLSGPGRALGAQGSWGPCGNDCGWRRRGSHAPSLARANVARAPRQRGPGGGVVALWTAGDRRRTHAAGHAPAGCPAETPQGFRIRATLGHLALEAEGGERLDIGPMDRQVGDFLERARRRQNWGPGFS